MFYCIYNMLHHFTSTFKWHQNSWEHLGNYAYLVLDPRCVVLKATEAIVDAALAENRRFAVVPCCVFAERFNHRELSPGRNRKWLDCWHGWRLARPVFTARSNDAVAIL